MSRLFSIVDIETNGGFGKTGKITEIAIFITDGEKIISEYSTLINPEVYIPPYIENLTGISNEMVQNAPKFYEIAKNIIEITENTVFVAHNVSFDYNFVKQEFLQLGYDYKRETLCTLRLSRKFFKGYKSYSLGNICNSLNISLNNRHRAFGDARATVELFYRIYKYDFENFDGINIMGLPFSAINESLDPQIIKNLPRKSGTYYFYDQNNEIIYINKAKNIRSNVISFFSKSRNDKIKKEVIDIDFKLTGCGLISDLRLKNDLRTHNPKYNKLRNPRNWGIYKYYDNNGYIRFGIENIHKPDKTYLEIFTSQKSAYDKLMNYYIEFQLCHKSSDFHIKGEQCIFFKSNDCRKCWNDVPVDLYNNSIVKLLDKINFNIRNAYILINDCDNESLGVIKIEDYEYAGYGFMNSEYSDLRLSDIDDIIEQTEYEPEAKNIIHQYLKTNKKYKIMKY
jgi:DNA polymerase-3 subunit epsilon